MEFLAGGGVAAAMAGTVFLAFKLDKADNPKQAVFTEDCVHEPTKPAKDRDQDFVWALTEEPHFSRRKAIVAAHPEVKELFGHEPLTKYICLAIVALQLAMAYLLKDMTWTWQFFVVAYVIGGTCNQALFLGIHEVTHNLGFKTFWHNKAFNCISNLPIGLPYCAAFKGYHLEHHKYQGVEGVDTDLPTRIEGLFFQNVFTKTVFATCQILFYAIRPMLVRQQTFTKWHAINWATQFTFNALVVYFFGWGPIFYFLVSDFMAGTLHPCASHFIAEHYVFVGEFETYSYYGPLNWLCFNVGYHNEHHDFPNIPWSRLPKLRKIAPEFYNNIPYHKSWPMVIFKFIMDPNVGTFNRVKREQTAGKKMEGAKPAANKVKAN